MIKFLWNLQWTIHQQIISNPWYSVPLFFQPGKQSRYLFWWLLSTRFALYLRPQRDRAWMSAVYCFLLLCNLILSIQFETDSPEKMNDWSKSAIIKFSTLTFGADASPPSPCKIAGSTNLIPRTSIRPRSRRFCKKKREKNATWNRELGLKS